MADYGGIYQRKQGDGQVGGDHWQSDQQHLFLFGVAKVQQRGGIVIKLSLRPDILAQPVERGVFVPPVGVRVGIGLCWI